MQSGTGSTAGQAVNSVSGGRHAKYRGRLAPKVPGAFQRNLDAKRRITLEGSQQWDRSARPVRRGR